jgi:glycerol-1-phosphate dehydrogenase [NAD(P)+]
MNASGYADLAAKVAAGADWIAADALGVEPIDRPAWDMVQSRLRWWLADPAGVRAGDRAAVHRLTTGLMMGGFAMQRTMTSRVASGAEHQFSHLWDMQHHTHDGVAPSHGFKVGIGTLASVALYEQLLATPLGELDVERCVEAWPDRAAVEAEVRAAFDSPELTECGLKETAAKDVTRAELREQLTRLKRVWPELKQRLTDHLLPFEELRGMLRTAGCPTRPEEIGIGRSRLRASHRLAYFIRRRFTVLDLARRAGVLGDCLERTFGPDGPWASEADRSHRHAEAARG